MSVVIQSLLCGQTEKNKDVKGKKKKTGCDLARGRNAVGNHSRAVIQHNHTQYCFNMTVFRNK